MAYSALSRSGSVEHPAPPQAVPKPRATIGVSTPRDPGVPRPRSEKVSAAQRGPGVADKTPPVPPEAPTARARPDPPIRTPSRLISPDLRATDRSISNSSRLIRFLIILVILSGLTCLYVWQAHTISVIRSGTDETLVKMDALEQENVKLMLDYARLDAPDYIEVESKRAGMVVSQALIRVPQLSGSETSGVPGDQGRLATARQVGDLLPVSLMAKIQVH